ncbi:MAG: hypothetical protein HQL50_07365 [Magnetococcales bacterium]|nr:hypothetical protein [Magnetococcales bacterium]
MIKIAKCNIVKMTKHKGVPSETLKHLMVLGFTANEIAKDLGLTAASISGMRRGNISISQKREGKLRDTLQRLCDSYTAEEVQNMVECMTTQQKVVLKKQIDEAQTYMDKTYHEF